MIKEGKFGLQEAVSLITITISSKVFFTSPSLIADFLGTSGWYMTLISASTAAVGFTFIYFLLKRFPGKNIVEIFNIALGRYAGFVFSGFLALLMMDSAASETREFAEVLKVYTLPLSPVHYILLIFIAGVTVLCYLGLESIARLARLFAYILLAGLIMVIVLSWENFSFHRIHPIFGYGIAPTVYHGAMRSSVYREVIILAVIAGSLQGTKYIKKAGYISLMLSGIIISASLLAFTLTFPYYTASEITSPMYQMTTLISYGRFIQRVDPVFLLVWIISAFISVIAIFYTFLSIYCKMFRMQDIRPVLLPSAIILFTVSMIPKDITTVAFGIVQQLRSYGWVIAFVFPLITLITAKIRKKGAKQNV